MDHVSARYDLNDTGTKTVAGYGSPLINNGTCNTEGLSSLVIAGGRRPARVS